MQYLEFYNERCKPHVFIGQEKVTRSFRLKYDARTNRSHGQMETISETATSPREEKKKKEKKDR